MAVGCPRGRRSTLKLDGRILVHIRVQRLALSVASNKMLDNLLVLVMIG